MTELETPPTRNKRHTPAELLSGFRQLAKRIGTLCGVEMSVEPLGDLLFFVDDQGDRIVDGDSDILCCTLEEANEGDALKLFSGRAMYAATTLKVRQ